MMGIGKKGMETRKRIIDESLQLFSFHGYHNTSISDILEATGLTKGGLYGHFSSKKHIWEAVYEEAGRVWRGIVFEGIREIDDPLERLERVIEADMGEYLGKNVFKGGCFFLNMLVELAGQSPDMAERVWSGFDAAGRLFASWLIEAEEKGILKPGLNHREISNFILISLNGAAALYAPTKDPTIWQDTVRQLRSYLRKLRK
jgi:AcrR family transcriptional regulator